MRRVFRNIIFVCFAATFIIVAPLLVLYTAGYRYNSLNGHIVRTGVLAVSSLPRGANISVPVYSLDKKTPFVINRIIPGEYQVTLTKSGYHNWQQKLTVISGQTSYANDILLFRNLPPALLTARQFNQVWPAPDKQSMIGIVRTEKAAEVWSFNFNNATLTMIAQYPARSSDVLELTWSDDNTTLSLQNISNKTTVSFTADGVPINDLIERTNDDPIILVANKQAVEIHNATTAEQPLIGLLPTANYSLSDVHGTISVVLGDNGTIYIIDTKASNPIVLAGHGTMYDFDETNNLLAWSDGVEIHTFDLSNSTTTFITRQSKAVISLAWQATGKALLASTNDDVLAFSLDSWKTITPLLTGVTISSFWLNNAGDTGYFYGDYDGTTGLFMLPITK